MKDSPTDKLLKLRTILILFGVGIGLIFTGTKGHAFGWPFHPPEIEGGLEVTMENQRGEYIDPEKYGVTLYTRQCTDAERREYEKEQQAERDRILREELEEEYRRQGVSLA